MPYCRVAPSLGALEGTPLEAWGTPEYVYKLHKNEPTVFFGLYDLRDYLALWRHKGKKWVLWAGSDIRNLRSGFVFNDGKLKWLSKLLRGNWWVMPILVDAEHWVENLWELKQLQLEGITSHVTSSFMGNIADYQNIFRPNNKVYLSCGMGRQVEYGFDVIERIADKVSFIEFHLYGDTWETKHPNVIVHGRVPKEQMNEEIKHMGCGLRLNETDGFSEITAKAILWGQWAVTRIPNYRLPNFRTDEELIQILCHIAAGYSPHKGVREWYIDSINKYPWYAKPL